MKGNRLARPRDLIGDRSQFQPAFSLLIGLWIYRPNVADNCVARSKPCVQDDNSKNGRAKGDAAAVNCVAPDTWIHVNVVTAHGRSAGNAAERHTDLARIDSRTDDVYNQGASERHTRLLVKS